MTTLLRDLVRTSLGRVRDELQQQKPALSAAEVHDLVIACCAVEPLLQGQWQRIVQRLAGGIEATSLAAMLAENSDAVQNWSQSCSPIRELVRSIPGPYAGREKDLALLAEAAAAIERLRQDLSALLEQTKASPPQVDPAKLRGGGSEVEVEGFRDVEDILMRLRAGEDL